MYKPYLQLHGLAFCDSLMVSKIRLKRLSEHRDYPEAGKVEEPSGHHFSLPGHAVSNLQGLATAWITQNPFVIIGAVTMNFDNSNLKSQKE